MSQLIGGTSTARARRRRAALVLIAGALVACSNGGEPVKITSIDLGSQVNDDNSVSSPSETFTPTSTIYASIATDGVGAGTLVAQWVSADGQILTDQTQPINATKPAHFEFHFAPAGGWPKGRHKVVFTLNGAGARTRDFEVR